MTTVTPAVLLHDQVDTLVGHIPRVFDGDMESIHEARVATRRLRELLPLVRPSDAHVEDSLRAAGRDLGRVRELDVMIAILDGLIERTTVGAGVIAAARQSLRERQRLERRAMVEGLERLNLEGLRDALAPRPRRGAAIVHLPTRLVRRADWVQELWSRIATRSTGAADAVRHATGIYFPNRAHRARVSIKKLRYAIEVAGATGEWKNERLLKDLRRIQRTLGELHDRQVLLDSLNELVPASAASPDLPAVNAMIHDDLARYHAEYVRRRDRILTIANVCGRAAARAHRSWSRRRQLVAASVVAVPLLLIGRRHTG